MTNKNSSFVFTLDGYDYVIIYKQFFGKPDAKGERRFKYNRKFATEESLKTVIKRLRKYSKHYSIFKRVNDVKDDEEINSDE